MSTSPSDVRPAAAAGGAAPIWRPLFEWLFWIAVAALAWSQTAFFDQSIREYRFGATGWPRAICLMIAAGATAQLLLRLRAGGVAGLRATGGGEERAPWQAAQRIAIFVLPFAFLWLAPRMGFYVSAPLFVLALLLLLEVRSPLALLGITGLVYGLFLLLFTRLFYVALPVGRWDPFYGVNEAIIAFARLGT